MSRRHGIVWLLLACLVRPAWADATAAGALAADPSPYLRLHASDPVAWRPLDEAALAAARAQDRLIFVTVGYFSCYWCHVMQDESFVDAEVAARLNADFIPTVVDRELASALDAALIDFVRRTRGTAGWPLNVVLTPDGQPLFGTTYLPRDRFLELLERLAKLWREEREELLRAAAAGAQLLARPPHRLTADLDPTRGPAYRALLVDEALRLADPLAGGFGDQAKFPSAPQLLALLDAQRATPRPELGAFLRLTLDGMAGQGLRDHVGGGFFRYTTDPQWQEPHFEKMLYDNAQLARLYLEASRQFAAPHYRDVAFDTLDFVLRDLALGDGSFASSLSAVDPDGVEGTPYLWDAAALARVLDDGEREVAVTAWGLSGDGEFDAGHLPVPRVEIDGVAARLGRTADVVATQLASARSKLLAERLRARPVPRDGKALSGWNGLLLEALAAAVAEPGGARYRAAGRALRDHLIGVAWRDGALASLVHDRVRVPAELGDYVHVAAGLWAWARVDGDPLDARTAQAVARAGFARHFDATGWSAAERPLLPFMGRDVALPDGALRSPSALLAATALALGTDDALRARAMAALNVPDAVLLAEPFWHATLIDALARLAGTDGSAGGAGR